MKKNDLRALAAFVLGVLLVALLIDLAVAISFGGALLLALAAIAAVVSGVEIVERLKGREPNRAVDRAPVV